MVAGHVTTVRDQTTGVLGGKKRNLYHPNSYNLNQRNQDDCEPLKLLSESSGKKINEFLISDTDFELVPPSQEHDSEYPSNRVTPSFSRRRWKIESSFSRNHLRSGADSRRETFTMDRAYTGYR